MTSTKFCIVQDSRRHPGTQIALRDRNANDRFSGGAYWTETPGTAVRFDSPEDARRRLQADGLRFNRVRIVPESVMLHMLPKRLDRPGVTVRPVSASDDDYALACLRGSTP